MIERADELMSEERDELRRLRKQVRELEQAMLSRPPDDPSGATRLRDRPALQVSYLSTQNRGAGHNRRRRHSALGQLSPMEYESQHHDGLRHQPLTCPPKRGELM